MYVLERRNCDMRYLHLYQVQGNIRNFTKIFPLRNVGDVHLSGGDVHGFQRIQDRHGRVRISAGV